MPRSNLAKRLALDLRYRIRTGRAVPVISDETIVDLALGGYAKMVHGYADKVVYYPMPDKENLAKVSKYYWLHEQLSAADAKYDYLNWVSNYIYLTAQRAGHEEATLREAAEQMDELPPSKFANLLGYPNLTDSIDNPLLVLAALPVSIYLTTSPYTFMEDALKAAGKVPRTDFCRWSKLLDNIPSSLPSDYRPSVAQPLVYHLHGIDEYPDSLVLTEDDYLEFIVNVAVNQGSPGDCVLPVVRQVFFHDYLIMFGFNPLDWPFRSLSAALIRTSPRWEDLGVCVLPPVATEAEMDYLQDRIRRGSRCHVSWSSVSNYLQELLKMLDAE